MLKLQKGSLKSSIMGFSLERKDKDHFNIKEKQKKITSIITTEKSTVEIIIHKEEKMDILTGNYSHEPIDKENDFHYNIIYYKVIKNEKLTNKKLNKLVYSNWNMPHLKSFTHSYSHTLQRKECY
jgi:hypothetical protein